MTPHPVIARVREIVEQATKGPWEECSGGWDGEKIEHHVSALDKSDPEWEFICIPVLHDATEADARAIVLDRNLSSPALDVIEAAAAWLAQRDLPMGEDNSVEMLQWAAADDRLAEALRAALDAWTQAATQEIGEGR